MNDKKVFKFQIIIIRTEPDGTAQWVSCTVININILFIQLSHSTEKK